MKASKKEKTGKDKSIKELENQCRRLLGRVKELGSIKNVGTCVWCGTIFDASDSPKGKAALLAHARTCEGNPNYQRVKELENELAQVKKENAYLREHHEWVYKQWDVQKEHLLRIVAENAELKKTNSRLT